MGIGGVVNLAHIVQHIKDRKGGQMVVIQAADLGKENARIIVFINGDQAVKGILDDLCLFGVIYLKSMELPALFYFL